MIYEWMGKKMLLNEMELDIDQIAENLNAFEKFLDTLPEKALGLGVRVLLSLIHI